LDDLHKKGLHVISEAIFLQIKARWVPFLPDFNGFSGILPGFSPNQNFWGCSCTPYTPASYTTGFGSGGSHKKTLKKLVVERKSLRSRELGYQHQ